MSNPIAPADTQSPEDLGPSATFVPAGMHGVFGNYRATEDGLARITEDDQIVELEADIV